ncbi:hypothetical protein Gorai_003237 [Gossypium raimondii]|uniref:Uncharacterized protein n=1 Tax=Gossypium raimondii TaxID=29730 RepID=A0A7J8QNR9_GOSRA|nr:hypothetical protein [Gossypium raimondii]
MHWLVKKEVRTKIRAPSRMMMTSNCLIEISSRAKRMICHRFSFLIMFIIFEEKHGFISYHEVIEKEDMV